MENTQEFLLAILSVSFLCWAGVIAWIGNGIRSDLREEAKKLNTYIVQTEKRLATIETQLGLVKSNSGYAGNG
jgi:ABC-type uncharacterized transport system involved in gliding motility auxiliary subunit